MEEAVLRTWPSDSGREGSWGRAEGRGWLCQEGEGAGAGAALSQAGCESGGKVWTLACTLRETWQGLAVTAGCLTAFSLFGGGGCCYDYSCFIEEIEAQRGQATCLRWHSWKVPGCPGPW